MLAHRLLRSTNNKPTLIQRIVWCIRGGEEGTLMSRSVITHVIRSVRIHQASLPSASQYQPSVIPDKY